MKISQHRFAGLLVLCLLLVVSSTNAEIVVITSKATKQHGVSLDELGKFYLGKNKVFNDGVRVRVVDQATGSEIRKYFYRKVLNLSETEINRYWSKRKFIRKLKPPIFLTGDFAIKQWVITTPGSLGYIDSKSVDNSVKILQIIP